MSSVILLGAGASRGTLGEEAPSAADFGKYLGKAVPGWADEYPHLAAVVRFLRLRIAKTSEKSWALDEVWGAIDNRVKLRRILGLNLPGAPFPPPRTKTIYQRNLDAWGLAGFELRCALARVFGTALDSPIQKAAKGKGTMAATVKQLQPGDCVISFNYDLLVERIIEALGKRLVTANASSDSTDCGEAILLCKPHGSLNWRQTVPEDGRAVQILGSAILESAIDFDPAQNATVQPVIIGPVPFKSELILPELQSSVSHSDNLLLAQWSCAIQHISEAERLVVLGYGFPSEDLHARFLFTEAAARRKSGENLEIEVYERSERQFTKVNEQIRAVFGPASRSSKRYRISCTYRGEVLP
ncbi:MAG: hypothetical protein HYX92_18735 [Chloroflexi bacterium]|nr:hypothetical protein [Chloroflexota bacterium]